jgi:hypothetical protein
MSSEKRMKENLRLCVFPASVAFYDGPRDLFDKLREIQMTHALYSELI